MRLRSFKNFSSIFAIVFIIGFVFLAGQIAAAQTKKPRTNTRTLEQPPAEKENPVTKQPDTKVETPRTTSKVKKVMVTDFDARGIIKWWGGNWDIGSLFANLIIGPLSRTEGYEVVERSRMKEVFDELNLSESERFSQSAVTKAGRQLGADYILFGFLTDFTRKKGGFGFYKEYSASISYSARLVDVATGKVFKSAEINYISPKQKEVSLTKETELNPNDPEFLQTLFGKAITETTKTAVVQLTGENVGQTQTTATSGTSSDKKETTNNSSGVLQGKVADVTNNTITINRGRSQGVKEGQFFAVVKVVREIKDPDTGKVISQKTEELARLKITKVEDDAAEGVLVSGDIKMLTFGTQVVRVDAKK